MDWESLNFDRSRKTRNEQQKYSKNLLGLLASCFPASCIPGGVPEVGLGERRSKNGVGVADD